MAEERSPVEIELETLIRARYPIIYIVSWEEKRVEETLRDICQRRGKNLIQWTFTTGMAGNVASRDPLQALEYILNAPDQSVFLLKDFHPFITDVAVTRRLRDLIHLLQSSFKHIVILSPILKLPPELEKEITVVDYKLPTSAEIDRLLEGVIQAVRGDTRLKTDLGPQEREQVLQAASGLTSIEAANVFAKSLVETKGFDVDVILGEKEQIIRKSGILEYFRASEAFADVGGLDLLKDWLRQRTASFSKEAREYGLPEPRGLMLLGVQGSGKSLTAKAIASQWKLPLLRLDIGKVFSGIVGSSEENMRRAIATAESVAPAILWIDELEKGLSGTQSSGSTDGGTTSRVFSTFLTWLSEKKAPVFVVATSNDVTQLPPELLRKGRFDEIFFVDLPARDERDEIFAIHLKKRKRDPGKFDLEKLAEASAGYSGAEIEQAVIGSLFSAFNDGIRELTTEDLLTTINESVPLSITMREGIQRLREWAETRARQASSQQSESTEELAELESARRFDEIENRHQPSSASTPTQQPSAADMMALLAGMSGMSQYAMPEEEESEDEEPEDEEFEEEELEHLEDDGAPPLPETEAATPETEATPDTTEKPARTRRNKAE